MTNLIQRLFFMGFLTVALAGSPVLRAAYDDAPMIVITSPDTASTFVYGSIKKHSLIWDKKTKMLIAQITFIDSQDNNGSANEDTYSFKLPGVTFDETKGIWYATSAKGVLVPVAHTKKTLFIKSIETLPNAIVRIQRQRGNVAVVLEAVSPSDPSLRAPASDTKTMDLQNLFH